MLNIIEGANFVGTDLKRTNFTRANLKYARNLKYTLNLESADFFETRVTRKESKIIKRALKQRKLFIVE